MGSKLIRFCLISIVITNIIFFIFVLIIRQFNYDEIIFKNEFIYEIFEKIDISIYFHYIMLIMLLLGHEIVNFFIYYKLLLVFYIVVNCLFLDIILKKKYNKLIYILYLIINTLLIIPIYYYINLGRGTILDILIHEFREDNLFLYIIFFLEVILPVIYFRNYKYDSLTETTLSLEHEENHIQRYMINGMNDELNKEKGVAQLKFKPDSVTSQRYNLNKNKIYEGVIIIKSDEYNTIKFESDISKKIGVPFERKIYDVDILDNNRLYIREVK